MSELVWKSIADYEPNHNGHYLFADDRGKLSVNHSISTTHFAEVSPPDGIEEAWRNYEYRNTLKSREEFFKAGFRAGRASR